MVGRIVIEDGERARRNLGGGVFALETEALEDLVQRLGALVGGPGMDGEDEVVHDMVGRVAPLRLLTEREIGDLRRAAVRREKATAKRKRRV